MLIYISICYAKSSVFFSCHLQVNHYPLSGCCLRLVYWVDWGTGTQLCVVGEGYGWKCQAVWVRWPHVQVLKHLCTLPTSWLPYTMSLLKMTYYSLNLQTLLTDDLQFTDGGNTISITYKREGISPQKSWNNVKWWIECKDSSDSSLSWRFVFNGQLHH